MRANERYLWWIALVALAALLGACGGGASPEGTPGEEPAPEPGSGGVPEPPPEEDLVIDPNGLSVGGNAVSSDSSVTANTLPPTMFGTATTDPASGQYNFAVVVGGNRITGVTTVTITQQSDSSKTLTVSLDSSGAVSWNNSGTEASAYTPSDYNHDCSLMPADMAAFFGSGNTFTYNNGTVQTPLSGSASIELQITPDDTTKYQECP